MKMFLFRKNYLSSRELRLLFKGGVDFPSSTEGKSEDVVDPVDIRNIKQIKIEKKGPIQGEEAVKNFLLELPRKGELSYLVFDGVHMQMVIRDMDTGGTIKVLIPAVSGKSDENEKFDYSAWRWYVKDGGPIPPGIWEISPIDVQEIGIKDRVLGLVGFGGFPGGTRSWGKNRVNIFPVKGTDDCGREGLYIHGGATPDSRGCLDLVENNDLFFAILEKYNNPDSLQPIEVVVDYEDLKDEKIAYTGSDVMYTVPFPVYAKNHAMLARTNLQNDVFK